MQQDFHQHPDQEQMKHARARGHYDKIWQKTGKCVFCDLKDKYILMEENEIALTVNLYPYIDGQLMAVPRQHITSPKQLSQAQWETIRKFSYLAKKMIRQITGIKSMWTLIREGGTQAQMTVSDHLHVHFIPFDQPDLCQWHYRQLQLAPLENIARYRQAADQLIHQYQNFHHKYLLQDYLPVACDVIMVNTIKGQKCILFQEKTAATRIHNDEFTLPGGHRHHSDLSLEQTLQREVREEINYQINVDKLQLLASRQSTLERVKPWPQVQKEFFYPYQLVWNSYLLTEFDQTQAKQLIPNDDCKKIIWLPIKEALQHPRVGAKIQQLIANFNEKILLV